MSVTQQFSSALSGRYVVERELGRGGMAVVYLARDIRHDRPVAIKVLERDVSESIGLKRFETEVRLTAKLDHPHILTLIDSGEADGLLYYVMPYVRGESLRARLTRERRLPLDEALRITREVGSALAYAHAQGIVHRDVKPENVLLHEGEAMLADFGIALALADTGDRRLTDTGTSLGTPAYMSPEQATGDRIDARSDVYSLGALVYEMLTGEPPISAATHQAFVAKLMTERPTRVRTLRDTVPESVEAAVMRALEKVPADRFQTVEEFAQVLDRPATIPKKSPRRSLTVAAILFVIVVSAAAIAAARKTQSIDHVVLQGKHQLTDEGTVQEAIPSPDGRQVAYLTRTCEGRCTLELRIMDVRGGKPRTIRAGFKEAGNLRWAPNGKTLMLWTWLGTSGMYLLNPESGEIRPLPNNTIGGFVGGGDSVAWTTYRSDAPDTSTSVVHISTTAGQVVDSFAIKGGIWALEGIPFKNLIAVGHGNLIARDTIQRIDVVDLEGKPKGGLAARLGWLWATQDALWYQQPTRSPLMRYPLRGDGTPQPGGDTVAITNLFGLHVSVDGRTATMVENVKESSVYRCRFPQWAAGACGSALITHSTKSVSHSISPDGVSVLQSNFDGDDVTYAWIPTGSKEWLPLSALNGMRNVQLIDSVTASYVTEQSARNTAGLLDLRTQARRSEVSVPAGKLELARFDTQLGWLFLMSSPRALLIRRQNGITDRFPYPGSLTYPSRMAADERREQVLVVGVDPTVNDTLYFDVLSLASRRWERWLTTPGWLANFRWQADGSIVAAIYESSNWDANARVYRIEGPGRVTQMAVIPKAGWVSFDKKLQTVITQKDQSRGDAWVSSIVPAKR